MSIFRRNDQASSATSPSGGSGESSSPASAGGQRRRVTHIAPGTRVEGVLSGATELLIDGEVVGEVRVQAPVVIGTDGVVQGPVTANTVRVGGRVAGNVQATERVEVSPSGSLEGDIAAPRVVIAEGAFFKGRVEMHSGRGGDKTDKAPQPERQEKAPERAERSERPERNEKPVEGRRRGNGSGGANGQADAGK
jgi:cytoskeletal protein CcmA (bactofilin family)